MSFFFRSEHFGMASNYLIQECTIKCDFPKLLKKYMRQTLRGNEKNDGRSFMLYGRLVRNKIRFLINIFEMCG